MKAAVRALMNLFGQQTAKKIPVLVEEFKNAAEIIRQYTISWLTRAILFISKQYQPGSSVPTTEELREQEDSN